MCRDCGKETLWAKHEWDKGYMLSAVDAEVAFPKFSQEAAMCTRHEDRHLDLL